MRFSIVATVLRKELTETLRDWRTLLLMVGLPVLLYPVMILGATQVGTSQTRSMEARVSTVAVWGSVPDDLRQRLDALDLVRLVGWDHAPAEVRQGLESGSLTPPPRGGGPGFAAPGGPLPNLADVPPPGNRPGGPPTGAPDGPGGPEAEHPVVAAARAALDRRVLDAVLVPWQDFPSRIAGGGLGRLGVLYDWVRPDSKQAYDRIRGELIRWREDLVHRREQERGLEQGFAQALDLVTHDVALPQKVSGHVLGTAISFLLIVMSLLGGVYPSIDLTAGEKERGTMETLLCAPLRPVEIILGKFFAVWAISTVAGLANLLSMTATLTRVLPGQGWEALSLDAGALLLIFLLYVPVSFLTSAAFLAVGVFAKDFKDGQNLVTPAYMVFALPAGLILIPGVELDPGTAFVPVLNMALLIKSLLYGEARADLAFLALLSSAAYGMMAVLFAARVFESAQVLLGGRESLRSVLGLERRGGLPSPAFACVAAAALLVALFYGSLLLDGRGLAVTMLGTQLGLVLLPTLGCCAAFGFPWRETLALRRPPAWGIAAAVAVGLSAWTFAAGVLVPILPPPESLLKEMSKLLLGEASWPLWVVILLIGVLPGVCEEVLFRGLVLTGLRRLGAARAIGLSALFFGVFHVSLYRLLPTVFLGIVIGILVWRTGSVFCGILAHAINNGWMAAVARSESLSAWLGLRPGEALPGWLIAAGSTVLVLSLILLWQAPAFRRPDAEDEGAWEPESGGSTP